MYWNNNSHLQKAIETWYVTKIQRTQYTIYMKKNTNFAKKYLKRKQKLKERLFPLGENLTL